MCDLLGVCSQQPVTIEMSFTKLMERARTANPDGWGAVFYRGPDAYIFREPRPGADSRLADNLAQCGVPSQLIISHIRKATQGEVSLRNTHPFCRELNGRLHSFAFNGDVPAIYDLPLPSDRFIPMGDSDAEYAYCYLLNLLTAADATDKPQQMSSILYEFGLQLSAMGPANFLYSDSRRLYAFASRRRYPNKEEYPPGMYLLSRHCEQLPAAIEHEGLRVQSTTLSPQEITLLSSVPLSDENWIPLPENQLLVIQDGRVIRHLESPEDLQK